MKLWMIFFFFLISSAAISNENKNELEDFAKKYLDSFQDKFSYKDFKMVLDINNSEIIIKKNYGTFIYKFDEYHIDDGEMVIEKDFENINFQLLNNSGNPLLFLSYKIKFD